MLYLDDHVEQGRHFYSVPHPLVHERVDLRRTAQSLEIFHKEQRVAVHPIPGYIAPGGYSTLPTHMPKAHQKHLDWTPTRLISWGQSVGPKTAELVEAILFGTVAVRD